MKLNKIGVNMFDELFRFITFFGDETFLLIIIPFIYLYDRRVGIGLISSLSLAIWTTSTLKATLKVERPPKEFWKTSAAGYSFPSGHATDSAAFWGYLGIKYREKKIYPIIFGFIIFLVGLSRIYLGVHWTTDVIGGWIVGISMVFFVNIYMIKYDKWVPSNSAAKIALSLIIPYGLAGLTWAVAGDYIHDVINAIKIMSTFSGVLIGHELFSKNGELKEIKNIKAILIRGTLGLLLLMALYVPYKILGTTEIFVIALIYWLIGFILSYVAPKIIIYLEK